MMTSTSRSRLSIRPPARRGFTLVELVVGLLLLTIGLIGSAATATVLTRYAAAAARAERATSLAVIRAAELRAGGCVATSGTRVAEPHTVSWVVRAGGRSARVDVSVSWSQFGAPRSIHHSSGFVC
jgi:prepilin-type N-terminal cleavage/methylation domain-containing protein